ncbi:MAG TPA: hypothetical protein VGI95_02675 [Caulobacteraceae bacterium]|jgi:hypothetical protein
MSQVQTINGYLCLNCSDVSLAQKGQNPAHPTGSPSNPTGATPNGPLGPNPKDNAGAVAGATPSSGSAQSPNAVVFGGLLSGQSLATSPSGPPAYQTGTNFSLTA